MLRPTGRPEKVARKSSKLRRCNCISQCSKWNPLTERYEGEAWVTHSTQQRHLEQDRYRKSQERYRKSKEDNPIATFKVVTLKDRVDTIGREVAWLSSMPLTSTTARLAFRHNPKSLPHPSHDKLALDEKNLANSAFLFVEARYKVLLTELRKIPQTDDVDEVIGRIMDCLNDLEKLKSFEWDQQTGARDPASRGRKVWITDRHFRQKGPSRRAVRAAYILSLVLQNIHFVSRRALRIHLRGLRGVLHAAKCPSDILDAIPLDPRTCSRSFDIDPTVREYISCPKCHCLYAFEPDHDPVKLPSCTHRQTPASPQCGAELWRARRLSGDTYIHVPIRKYYHQELKSWIGDLVSRPGMEDILEQPGGIHPSTLEQPIDDIWGSKIVQELKGPDGQPFYPSKDGELRLLFGLAADGFLPYAADTQSVTSTGIWIVLYNLPVRLRYLPQNVFLVGVIPGPNKPSKDELNHYIQLVVDDLKEFWDPGVFFSRTFKYYAGRSALGALILVLGDHPGLRQLIGYAASSNAHYLCTGCDVDLDDIHIIDKSLWPAKNRAEILRYATSWRDAPNESAQRAVFEAYGWRWSPLFDLPYWDPVACSVVDTMHALDLNLFNNHCRNLFGIDAEHAGGDRSSALKNAFVYGGKELDDNDSDVIKCRRVLKANASALLDQLLEFDRPVLRKVCTLYNVVDRVIGVRHILAEHLYDWRMSIPDNFPFFDATHPENSQNPTAAGRAPTNSELTKKYRIIRKLLSDSESEWDSARKQSNFDLHGELCQAVGLSTTRGDTKASRHASLLSAIQSDSTARQKLEDLLPPEQLARLRAHVGPDDGDQSSVAGSQDVSDAETGVQSQSGHTTAAFRLPLPPSADSLMADIARASDPKAMKRLFRHIIKILPDGIEAGGPLTASSVKVQIYEEACSLLQVPIPAARSGQGRKEQLNRIILEALDSNSDAYNALCALLSPSEKDAVLDKHVLSRVWKDMQLTQLPSWIKRAPPNWGTAKRGTLSANHWQVICTIHLPITLIWLWREEDENSRKKALLRHFMHLVTASRLAYLRVSTPAQIDAFEHHIFTYISGIKELFPAHQLKPTHHTAMHIADMMRTFGPDHCRNARFYERYILFLHRVGINNKLGEIEKSFMLFSSRYAKLCAILEDDQQLHLDMDEMIHGIESIKREDLRGFDLSEAYDASHVTFSPDNSTPITLEDHTATELQRVLTLLNLTPGSRQVFSLSQISQGGVRYAAFQSRRYRDSAVIFRSKELPISERCGFVQLIFKQHCISSEQIAKDEIFLVVDEHTPIAQRGVTDPYGEFGFAAGYLCDKAPSRRHIVHLSDIVSHFAATSLEDTEFMHVMPVDRLMYGLDLGPDNRAF